MNDYTETTSENLRILRASKGLKQEAIADLLGLKNYHVSKIEKGERALSDSEKRLLDWYFFGTLPPSITASLDLPGVLELTASEWRVVDTLAKREGQTAAKWIASTIRFHLDIASAKKTGQGRASSYTSTDRTRMNEPTRLTPHR